MVVKAFATSFGGAVQASRPMAPATRALSSPIAGRAGWCELPHVRTKRIFLSRNLMVARGAASSLCGWSINANRLRHSDDCGRRDVIHLVGR